MPSWRRERAERKCESKWKTIGTEWGVASPLQVEVRRAGEME
jgi:hypothetical protein